MLSNAYFLAKFRFDTAENEPAKNLQNFAKFANFADPNPYCVRKRRARIVKNHAARAPRRRRAAIFRMRVSVGVPPVQIHFWIMKSHEHAIFAKIEYCL